MKNKSSLSTIKYKNIIVLIADRTTDVYGDFIDCNGIDLPRPSRMVPITLDFSTDLRYFLGWATLTQEGDRIRADMELILDKGSGKMKETYNCLTPAISGYIEERVHNCLKRIEIMEIGLSINHNADSRIKRLGDSKSDEE